MTCDGKDDEPRVPDGNEPIINCEKEGKKKARKKKKRGISNQQ